MTSIKRNTLMIAACAAFAPLAVQAQSPSPLPPNYIQVSAPFAQKIVVAAMDKHSNQIQKIGLHAVPPAQTDNVIIASNLPVKIGKKSSAPDLAVLAAGKPHVLRDEKGHFYDLALPIADRKGKDIGGGLLVMEVPFTDASSEEQALKIGGAIRDELQMEIPGKDALYR
jgi:hypothetical protein